MYLSYSAPGRQISRYALRGNRTAFFFVVRSPAKPRIAPRDALSQKGLLRDAFATVDWAEAPAILQRLATCDDLYFDAVSQIRMPEWSNGRIALIGDAAYCPSLLSGQGSALAMLGACVLAGELAAAQGDHRRAFAAYEQRLRRAIEARQRSALRLASSFTPATRAGLFVRDQALRLMGLPKLGEWMTKRKLGDDLVVPEYAEAATAAERA